MPEMCCWAKASRAAWSTASKGPAATEVWARSAARSRTPIRVRIREKRPAGAGVDAGGGAPAWERFLDLAFISGKEFFPRDPRKESKVTRTTGTYISAPAGGEQVNAFVPAPLPVSNPPLAIEGALTKRLDAAERALRHLELAAQMVPSPEWFLYAFVRKEAVLSSQIEGTQATLIDLLESEANNSTTPDVEEVSNYIEALKFARAQLASTKGLPLSMRLLNETHKRLM